MKQYVKGIILMAVLAVVGLSTVAFAGWGMGHGQGGCGWNNMGGHGNGSGYGSNLSADEIKRLDAEQSGFLTATEGIRKSLYEKELALRNELVKDNPDTVNASNLQADISKLRAELDQKSLNYEMSARKMVPNYNGGYNCGHGRGMHNGGCGW